MHPSHNQLERGPSPVRGAGDALAARLVRRLIHNFGIPPGDADAIVGCASVAMLSAQIVNDRQSWMAGMVAKMARAYWHRVPPPDATASESATIARIVFTEAVLRTLTPRVREALRLRVHGGMTYDDIASELNVTPFYAQRMVEKALAKIVRAQRK